MSNWITKIRLPNGDNLKRLRPDILAAALGRRPDRDFVPLWRSAEEAHRVAVRKKLDRTNAYLRLIVILLVLLVIIR